MAGARGGSLTALLSFRKSHRPDNMGSSETLAQAAPFSIENSNSIEGAADELQSLALHSCCAERTQLFLAAILAISSGPLTPDMMKNSTTFLSSGVVAPDNPHLKKMLELFTEQWTGFVAKEKKVLSCIPYSLSGWPGPLETFCLL